jgi:HD-like signal output (HDOD) protein
MRILREIVRVDDLPTIPESMLEVQRLANAESADAKALAKVIKRDPTLAARLLRIANSAFYGPRSKPISSIQFAITRLGFQEVARLALASSVIEQFALTFNTIDYYAFWRHSLAAAQLAQTICERDATPFRLEPSAAYMAGLLHDIGLLVYDRYYPRIFDEIANHSLLTTQSYLMAEQELLGKEAHCFVGGALMEVWKLEAAAVAAVRYHHLPEKAPNRFQGMAHILAVAEYELANHELGCIEGQSRCPEQSYSACALSARQASALAAAIGDSLERCDALLAR